MLPWISRAGKAPNFYLINAISISQFVGNATRYEVINMLRDVAGVLSLRVIDSFNVQFNLSFTCRWTPNNYSAIQSSATNG
jgi:hypothetical protein